MLSFGGQSVGASAVKLIDNVTAPSTIIITNAHATQVAYLGTSNAVTTTTGCPVPPLGSMTLRQVTGGQIWVIASGSSTPVGYAVGNEFG